MECTLFNQEEIHVATTKIRIFVTHMHYGTNAVLNLCDLELTCIILLIVCINILGFHCETILHVHVYICLFGIIWVWLQMIIVNLYFMQVIIHPFLQVRVVTRLDEGTLWQKKPKHFILKVFWYLSHWVWTGNYKLYLTPFLSENISIKSHLKASTHPLSYRYMYIMEN